MAGSELEKLVELALSAGASRAGVIFSADIRKKGSHLFFRKNRCDPFFS